MLYQTVPSSLWVILNFLTTIYRYYLFYPERNVWVLCEFLTVFGVTWIVPVLATGGIAHFLPLTSQVLCPFCPCSTSHWCTVKLTRISYLKQVILKVFFFHNSLKPRSLYPMPQWLSFSLLGTRTLCRLSSQWYSGGHRNTLRQVGSVSEQSDLKWWDVWVVGKIMSFRAHLLL